MTEKPVAPPSQQRCGEIAFPGPNEQVCVADAGHEEGKHNFWPRELVSSQDVLRRKTINFTPDDMEPRVHAKPGSYLLAKGKGVALPSSPAPTSGKFRKKPVVIDACQLPPLEVEPDEFMEWAAAVGFNVFSSERDGCLAIPTLEGTMTASPGDWIIKGVKGEFYPCKPDIFAATYEAESVPSTPSPTHIEWLKRDEIAGAFAQGYKLYAWDADAEEYMPVTGYVVSADGLRVELQTDSDECDPAQCDCGPPMRHFKRKETNWQPCSLQGYEERYNSEGHLETRPIAETLAQTATPVETAQFEGHTPGPWKVLLTREGKVCDGIVTESAWNAEDEYWEDYIVQTDSGAYGPKLPDAYLIAAAPDLLKKNAELESQLTQARSELAELRRVPAKENACQVCGRDNPVWSAPNEIWNRVFPDRVGFLCPICFIERADPIIPHIGWMLTPEYLDGGDASLMCQLDIKLSQTQVKLELVESQLKARSQLFCDECCDEVIEGHYVVLCDKPECGSREGELILLRNGLISKELELRKAQEEIKRLTHILQSKDTK